MNFQQARIAIESLVQGLPSLFADTTVEFYFGNDRPPIGDWSQPENMGMLITGDGIGCKSGVYFFISPEGEIIYIGKATKENLHHRVWDHVKTPKIMPDEKRIFPKHGFGNTGAQEQANHVLDGNVRLGVVTVSDPELVSLIEVFLHTVHAKEHYRLPALNKQIG
jgi:hypothetical protein